MGYWSDFSYMNGFRMIYLYYYYFKFKLLLLTHLFRKDETLPPLSSFLYTPYYNRGRELSEECNPGEYNSSQTTFMGQDHDNKFVSLPLSGSLLIRSQYVERVLSPIWERQTGILLSLGFGFFVCAWIVESGYSFITKVHFALCSKALFSNL